MRHKNINCGNDFVLDNIIKIVGNDNDCVDRYMGGVFDIDFYINKTIDYNLTSDLFSIILQTGLDSPSEYPGENLIITLFNKKGDTIRQWSYESFKLLEWDPKEYKLTVRVVINEFD